MHSGLCCGLYRGSFFLKDLSNPNAALLPVGNAEATITQELTEISQPNFQSLGGSNCKVEYVESMGLDLTLHCTSPENLAIALMGTASQLNGDTVTGELHPVNGIHELIPFNFIPRRDQELVVTDEGGITTYVENTDYIRTKSGIQIIEGSTIPVDGSKISVDYTYGDNYKVDFQTVSQKEFLVVLDGVNVGDGTDRPVVMKAWKVKFAPTDSFALISGTEFASLSVSGEILRDESKVTGSQFGVLEFGEAVSGVY